MAEVRINIDGKALTVDSDLTILEAARQNGIRIPTLCHFDGIKGRANCRICVVEIEGRRGMQPSCVTKVSEGMTVHTDSEAIRKSRKMTLQLIMSHHAVDCHHCMRIGSSTTDSLDPKFCEMCFWCDCERDGFCELQSLCREYKVDVLPFIQHEKDYKIDESLGSITRNPNKCIKCRRCVDVCNEVQTVHNLSMEGRGSSIKVVPELGHLMADSPCVRCGRCVEVCPCGALYMKEAIDETLYMAHSYDCHTVAMVPAAAPAELASLFDPANKCGLRTLRMEAPKALDMRKAAYQLKKTGVDRIFSDAEFTKASAADGARKLASALGKGQATVVITDSPAAVNFVKANFPKLADTLVVYDSAHAVFGRFAKTELASAEGWDPAQIKTIELTDRTEEQAEAKENGTVDYVMNSREFFRICLRTGGNLNRVNDREFDEVKLTAEAADHAEFFREREFAVDSKIEECTLTIGGREYKAASAVTLGHTRALLEQVEAGSSKYAVIRIQA